MTLLAPYPARSLDCEHLHSVLQRMQRVAVQRNQPQILSLSQEIPPQDLFHVMERMHQPGDPQFSFARSSAWASRLVAGGAAWIQTVQGSSRFAVAKQAIQQIFERCHPIGDHHPLAGPRILCSFSFFPAIDRTCPFPVATLVLPQWSIGYQDDRWIAVLNRQVSPETDVRELAQQLTHTLQQIALPLTAPSWTPVPFDLRLPLRDSNEFKHAVRSVLARIHHNQIQKVVLSESISLPLDQPLSLSPLLGRLHRIYPECTIFSFSLGQGPTFLGASPERLVSLQRGHFLVDALAGSAPRGTTAEQDRTLGLQLLASGKDRHEHGLVVTSIIQQLARLGLTVSLPSTPHLLKLPMIQHLHTPIQGCLFSNLSPLDLVESLHPTPAVAGTPTALACEQIRRWERFDRSLYAAPLGWVDAQGNGEFIVGIRSAMVYPDHLQLFAGAGIVRDSDPDREVAEVHLKMGALLQALTMDPRDT